MRSPPPWTWQAPRSRQAPESPLSSWDSSPEPWIALCVIVPRTDQTTSQCIPELAIQHMGPVGKTGMYCMQFPVQVESVRDQGERPIAGGSDRSMAVRDPEGSQGDPGQREGAHVPLLRQAALRSVRPPASWARWGGDASFAVIQRHDGDFTHHCSEPSLLQLLRSLVEFA